LGSIFVVTDGNFSHECTPGTEREGSEGSKAARICPIKAPIFVVRILLYCIVLWKTNFDELDYK
jgi:hypothetical protein